MKHLVEFLDEAQWSGKVDTKWHPKEGFYKQGAEKIASGIASAADSLKQAMSRLDFYINRAGSNLSSEDKSKFEKVKGMLRSKFKK